MSVAATSPPLRVAIDFKQPQSYLALAPTRALAAELGIAVDWLPVTVPPLSPPSAETAAASDDRGTRHLRFRGVYLGCDLHRYAAAQGLALGDIYRSPDVSLAGMGLLQVKAHAAATGESDAVDRYLDRVFGGYWSETLDIEDPAALRVVLEGVGAPAAELDTPTLRDELERVQLGLRGAGVHWAPAYLVGDELFIGREHLPMIRWLLDGKAGPAPA